jgi:uncharacterized membrane protein YgcG
VTAGDVAARAGLQLSDASSALNALAADTGATLQVSDAGDLLYVYRPGVRAALASKSWRLRPAPALAQAQRTGAFLVRTAFGATLLISIVVVFAAITLLLSSKSDERDDRRRSSGSFGGSGVRLGFNMLDFYFWDPYAMRRRRAELAANPGLEMGFLESVFSFVFGDGDPNEDFEPRRWEAVGALITRAGGVVTAEQLAPLLEPPAARGAGARGASLAGASAFDDEAFVLPALTRFGGVPEVTPAGGIVYRFPDLQRSGAAPAPEAKRGRGAAAASSAVAPAPLSERAWEFTAAPAANVALTLLLGAANAAGVIWLAQLLGDPAIAARAGADSVTAIRALLPALQVYAALFFTLPAVRYLQLGARNAAIAARNGLRRDAARVLAAPPPAVAAKLDAARAGAARTLLGDDQVVFSSDAKDARAAAAATADEGAEFERRLAEREAQRKSGGGSSGGKGGSGGW